MYAWNWGNFQSTCAFVLIIVVFALSDLNKTGNNLFCFFIYPFLCKIYLLIVLKNKYYFFQIFCSEKMCCFLKSNLTMPRTKLFPKKYIISQWKK